MHHSLTVILMHHSLTVILIHHSLTVILIHHSLTVIHRMHSNNVRYQAFPEIPRMLASDHVALELFVKTSRDTVRLSLRTPSLGL
jgi:hypothetical protein